MPIPPPTIPISWVLPTRRGEGTGANFTLNLPLVRGSGWNDYAGAVTRAAKAIDDFGADIVLVSLGLDTYEKDPISFFKISSDDYLRMGAAIAAHGKPTLFVFEGGYHVDDLALNTTNVLEGFLGG